MGEIAYLTSFANQRHSCRIFKQHTGQRPVAYRKGVGSGCRFSQWERLFYFSAGPA
jgi:AraC-like DNA-binding protein